jgi:hypothetical protein
VHLRHLAIAAGLAIAVSAILAPAQGRSQEGILGLMSRLKAEHSVIGLYSELQGAWTPSLKTRLAPTPERPIPSEPAVPVQAPNAGSRDVQAAPDSPGELARALEACGMEPRLAYPIPLAEADPDSCARIAEAFGLPPADFCALVATEASMHSPAKDTVQNTLASLGINPSLGLKEAEKTTIGCSQMSVATALNVLEKLKEARPDLYERLGAPEGEDQQRILLHRLAADCRFAVGLQAAYAMLNVGRLRPGPEGDSFQRFVTEIYNPSNPELHERFSCLRRSLAAPQSPRA